MSIVEEAVKRILNQSGNFEIIEADKESDDGIIIENYGELFDENKSIIEKILASESDLLGEYLPMKSPGKIILFSNTMASFFWELAYRISTAGYYMERKDLERMAHMVVLKTYTHEQFHHFADVARYLFGGSFDRNIEEALAVAWSRKKLQELRAVWSTKEARLATPIYHELLISMYRYTSKGYRDWVLYQSDAEFLTAAAEYLGGPNKDFLVKSGIDVGQVLLSVLGEVKNKGVIEQIM